MMICKLFPSFGGVGLLALALWAAVSCGEKTDPSGAAGRYSLTGPTELSAPEKGTTQEYSIQTTGSWRILRKSTESWAMATPSSGTGNGAFKIRVEENRSGQERSLYFSVVLDGKEQDGRITVTQDGTMLIWDESGHDKKFGSYTPCIPSYSQANYHYRKGGKEVLEVDLEEPIVLSIADKEMPWGYYQFPELNRATDGTLVLTWAMHEDKINGKGEASGKRISTDGGQTWKETTTLPFYFGRYSCYLAGGDLFNAQGKTAPDLNKMEGVPAPAYPRDNFHSFNLYRYSELPESLKNQDMVRGFASTKTRRTFSSVIEEPADFLKYSTLQDGQELFPFYWWGDKHLLKDHSVVTVIYPHFYEENGSAGPGTVACYRTQDEGSHWKYVGRIPYVYDSVADPNGGRRKGYGYTEPAFEILPNGHFVCVLRTDGDYGRGPMYLSHSSDQGKNWSTPVAFTPNGVLPRLLQLGNGVLVLASGRPGVQLRFSYDGTGDNWTDPFEMVPFEGDDMGASCGYTELLPLNENSFLVTYSDFRRKNSAGQERKGILVRKITVNKK